MTKVAACTFRKKLFMPGIILLLGVGQASAQAPLVSSFSPASGPVGTAVTITGTGFDATAANNIVFFGATRATVTAASTTSLTVTVPVGATYQPISVLNSSTALTGYSDQPFVTTFSPNQGRITAASFMPPVNFTTGSTGTVVSAGDIDGDGKPDLVLVSADNNTFSVLRNTSVPGSITAASFAAHVDFATGNVPQSIAVGDLDGDGKPDVVVENSGDSTVSVYRNTSTAGSISFAPPVTFSVSSGNGQVAIGDVDGDGKPDLVVITDAFTNTNNTSTYITTVSVLRNTSIAGSLNSASFAPAVMVYTTTGTDEIDLAISDIDGDGKPDLVISLYLTGEVQVLRNTSTTGVINSSSFAAPLIFSVRGTQPTFVLTYSVSVGDIDGDGKPDLVVANTYSNDLAVLRNTSTAGSVSFAAPVDFVLNIGSPTFGAIGDLDGDGKPDIALINGQDSIAVFRNTSTAGSITTNSLAPAVNFSIGQSPKYGNVIIADLDGDGKPDLAVALENYYQGESVAVLRNDPILPLSKIATLNNLTISQGTLNPVFATTTMSYTDTVAYTVTGVTVTPTVTDTTAKITVNGVPVASGTASGNIPLAVGSNTITVLVTAQDSITTDTYTITVYRKEAANIVYVPNAFTPNGDGHNDQAHVHGVNIKSMKFYVYDQWGELLFTSTNVQNGWDGTYKGRNEPVGVYVYYVEAMMNDGQTINQKGTITLIR